MYFRRKLTMPALAVMSVIIAYEILGHSVAFAFTFCLVSGTIIVSARKCKGNGDSGSVSSGGSERWIPYLSVVLVCVSIVHLYCIDSLDRALPGMAGDRVMVQGRITDIGIKKKGDEDRMSMVLRVDKTWGTVLDRPEKILIDCPYDEDRGIGDCVAATGKIKLPDPKRNPNTFDYRAYLRTKGIYVTMYAEDVAAAGSGSRSLFARLYRAKEGYLRALSDRAGDGVADMMRAILFGDKGRIDEDVEEVFRMNGTAHILAVSGLHVGMVYALILFIWEKAGGLLPGTSAGRRGWGFLLSVGSVLIMYAFLSGFAPSVIRAVLMILLHIFAGMTGRYYDLKSVTLAVFILSLMVDPLILFQSGFQMSFLAILSLSMIMPYLRRLVSGTLLAGACIQIGLMPYMIFQFNWLSLPAVLINVPVIFLAGLIVPLGMIAFVVSGVFEAFAGTSGSMGWEHAYATDSLSLSGLPILMMDRSIAFLCDLMIRSNELCCIEGLTAIRVCSPPAWMVFFFYMALVAFASESGRKRLKKGGKRAALSCAVPILAVSLILGTAVDDGYGDMDIVFVDVGQGDCMHLRIREGPRIFGDALPLKTRNYLIDGGGDEDYEVGTKTLRPYLLKNGVGTVDGAFVTHLHTDHYKGICELARAGMVDKLYVYESNRLKLVEICSDTGMDEGDIIFLKKGDRVILGRTLSGRITDYVDVLWPEGKSDVEYEKLLENEEDENASSLIMRGVVDGVSLLATGDLGEEGERELIDVYAHPTSWMSGYGENHKAGGTRGTQAVDGPSKSLGTYILKVGHHGSKYSSCDEFLDAVSPKLAVIQVSKGNTYGHPTPEVLKKLADRGIPTYRNDLQGAIGFSLSGGSIKEARTMIE